MPEELLYEERVTSPWTTALFAGLSALGWSLFAWRRSKRGLDRLGVVFGTLGVFFLFYVLNYRALLIQITQDALRLKFGIFRWTVPLGNVADCRLDDPPLLGKYGGAGIHFMLVRQRYRASFNFLEHPRVVVALKEKAGPVCDLSFSTRQPEVVIALLGGARAAGQAA